MRLDPTTSVLCHGSSSQLRRRSACERGVERPRRSKGGERNTEIGGRDKGQGEQWWKTGACGGFCGESEADRDAVVGSCVCGLTVLSKNPLGEV